MQIKSELSDGLNGDTLDRFDRAIEAGDVVSKALSDAVCAFPLDAALLADYAAARFVDHAAKAATLSDTESAIEQSIARRSSAAARPVTGILQRAKEFGKSLPALCAKLRIGKSVLTKIDRRLIIPATLPDTLLRALCLELRTTREQLASYLAAGPQLARGAQYKSHSTPQTAPPESFAQALATSVAAREMTAEDVTLWTSGG